MPASEGKSSLVSFPPFWSAARSDSALASTVSSASPFRVRDSGRRWVPAGRAVRCSRSLHQTRDRSSSSARRHRRPLSCCRPEPEWQLPDGEVRSVVRPDFLAQLAVRAVQRRPWLLVHQPIVRFRIGSPPGCGRRTRHADASSVRAPSRFRPPGERGPRPWLSALLPRTVTEVPDPQPPDRVSPSRAGRAERGLVGSPLHETQCCRVNQPSVQSVHRRGTQIRRSRHMIPHRILRPAFRESVSDSAVFRRSRRCRTMKRSSLCWIVALFCGPVAWRQPARSASPLSPRPLRPLRRRRMVVTRLFPTRPPA